MSQQPELADTEGNTINPHLDEDGCKANGDLELAGLGLVEVEGEKEQEESRRKGCGPDCSLGYRMNCGDLP